MVIILTFATAEERDKFEYLYTRYKRLLLHKAYEILKDYALAEDAVSEAYIRVYKNLHKVDDPATGRAAAFLVTIARNVALTMLAGRQRTPVEEPDENLAEDYDLEESTLASLGSQEIYAAVESLEEELRHVFLLRYSYDYSNGEIARLLQLSEGNVRVRLHRARQKLAKLLTKEGYRV